MGRFIWLALFSAAVTAGALWVLTDIFEKKADGRRPDFRVVTLSEATPEPEVWGQNYPHQYDSYLRTVDMERTRYGGSEALPRVPTEADPRSFVAQSMIEAEPRLKEMWQGYAFSVDYREKRGHAYMLLDQEETERQDVGQPGTCIHCHGSTVGAYSALGDGDPVKGFEALNAMTYFEAREHVTHPIACIDCHDPSTMALRISRPAFAEGIAAWKASQGVADYDANSMATRNEMRSYVCGQCHVEYYFSKGDRRLTFPWAKGVDAESMIEYYDEIDFVDWTHKKTGAKMLKAQHPEFEMWNQGIHGQAGVSCSDCHMPYERVGAQKVSSHHVRSPLIDVSQSCTTCHPVAEAEIRGRAEAIQEKNNALEKVALQAIVDLIAEIVRAQEAGAPEPDLEVARKAQRHAQFMIDYVVSENSTGFHADQAAAALLGVAIDKARSGQLALRKP